MIRWIALIFGVIVPLQLCAHPVTPSPAAADLVLLNGKIWTVDRERPEVEALAAWSGRILAIGTTTEIKTLIGPKTIVIDAKGRRIVPGFHDNHIHLLGAGLRLNQVALKDAKDIDEFGRRLTEFHRKFPRDRWIIGGGWDHDRAFAGRLPSAADLDRYVSDRPVFLRRYDGHMALANSRALALAGITAETPDPPDGPIDRDPKTREPTGILRDNAMALVDRIVPQPDQAEIVEAVRAALERMREAGVTSAVDMEGSTPKVRKALFGVYQQLARSGQLTARVEVRWPIAEWEDVARMAIRADFGNDTLRIGGVKGYIDGSLGSNTAKMFDPYLNDAKTTGLFVTPSDKMRELVTQADRAGLSIAVHAIGDQANAEMLDIFDAAKRQNGSNDARYRMEHAQHLRPQDYRRFAEIGVIACMQPYHVIDDGRWAEGRIGPQRCASSYAFRSLLDARAKLSFGSDWPIAPISPILGIDAAVNRQTLDGVHPEGWFPAQRIGIAEAIEAYTLGSAFASHQDKERGSIEVGKYADFAILSQDALAPATRNNLRATQVLVTAMGGKIVFDARQPTER